MLFSRCNIVLRSSQIYDKNYVKIIFAEHIDAVHIPPAVEALTDEEDKDHESNLQEFEEPPDIVGSF
ncbi:hypothetical protein JTB14_019534 [Gonioctena quinquepunctata]|nr:hypothetical protein JTB14_019534 [Gonioctena quinquepunctata]